MRVSQTFLPAVVGVALLASTAIAQAQANPTATPPSPSTSMPMSNGSMSGGNMKGGMSGGSTSGGMMMGDDMVGMCTKTMNKISSDPKARKAMNDAMSAMSDAESRDGTASKNGTGSK
jgi:hypothetical protein